jgi:hypothetical protein
MTEPEIKIINKTSTTNWLEEPIGKAIVKQLEDKIGYGWGDSELRGTLDNFLNDALTAAEEAIHLLAGMRFTSDVTSHLTFEMYCYINSRNKLCEIKNVFAVDGTRKMSDAKWAQYHGRTVNKLVPCWIEIVKEFNSQWQSIQKKNLITANGFNADNTYVVHADDIKKNIDSFQRMLDADDITGVHGAAKNPKNDQPYHSYFVLQFKTPALQQWFLAGFEKA